eukprot:759446-Hanusia_phi.AAC.2
MQEVDKAALVSCSDCHANRMCSLALRLIRKSLPKTSSGQEQATLASKARAGPRLWSSSLRMTGTAFSTRTAAALTRKTLKIASSLMYDR